MDKKLTMKFGFIFFVLVGLGLPNAFAKTLLSKDIDEVTALLKRRQEQMNVTRKEVDSLKSKIDAAEIDRKKHEEEFTLRLSKILLPLLHWPSVSFQKAQSSWILRDHFKFVLANMKSRLISEPVTLIAEGEKNLRDFSEYQSSLDNRLKEMLSHEELLALQLEELKILQARTRKAKR